MATMKRTRHYSEPRFMTQRKLYIKLPFERFLPSWAARPTYKKRLYALYQKNKEFRKALNSYLIKKQTANEFVNNYLEYVEHNKENFIVMGIGNIRSGKSRLGRKFILAAMRIRQSSMRVHMDPRKLDEYKEFILNDTWTEFTDIYITYNFTQSQHVFDLVKPGDVVFQDEMPRSRGKGSKNILKDIDNVLNQASGKRRLSFIFLNPFPVEMESIDLCYRILGVNKQKQRTCAEIFMFPLETTAVVHEGVLDTSVEEPPELTEYYETMSDKIKMEIVQAHGADTVEAFSKPALVKLLLDEIAARGADIRTKKALESIARDVKRVRDDLFFDDIVSDAYNQLLGENASKQDKKEDFDVAINIDNDFIVDPAKLLEQYPVQRDAAIWVEYQDPKVKQDELAAKYALDQSTISKIAGDRGEVTGWLNDRIGKLYEKYAAGKIERKWRDDPSWELVDIKNEGQHGKTKPDIRVDLKRKSGNMLKTIFYSVKCYNSPRKSVSIPIDELRPEIEAARQLKDKFPDQVVQVILYYYNRATCETIEREIRYQEPPGSILVKSNQIKR